MLMRNFHIKLTRDKIDRDGLTNGEEKCDIAELPFALAAVLTAPSKRRYWIADEGFPRVKCSVTKKVLKLFQRIKCEKQTLEY